MMTNADVTLNNKSKNIEALCRQYLVLEKIKLLKELDEILKS